MKVFADITRCSILLLLLVRMTQAPPLTKAGKKEELSQGAARQMKSEQMRKYMNESVDPCENFYEFACGNYAQYNPVDSEIQPVMSLLETLNLAMEEKIKHEFETEDAADTATDRSTKQFYKSCMNAPNMLSTYQDKLREILKEFGQLPMLEGNQWQGENDFDWVQVIGAINHKMHVSIILAVEIYTDFADKTINRVTIMEPYFSLKSKSIYEDEIFQVDRDKHIKTIAKKLNMFLGVDMNLAQQTAKEMLDFETALASGMYDEKLDLQMNEILTLLNIDEMQKKYTPVMDSKKLVSTIYGFVPNETHVQSQYVDNALAVVKQTPRRTLANYIFFHFLDQFLFDLPETKKELEQLCMGKTRFHFYRNVDNMIYRKYFTEQIKEGVYYMWKEMKSTFAEVLESPRMSWIQNETRRQALEKLKAMQLQINSFEDQSFEKDYADLNLNAQDVVDNMRQLLIAYGKKNRNKIHQPPKPEEPGSGASFSPIYSVAENGIQIPVSVLQPYYTWSLAFPNSFNYANLGFYVAHELIHGFDDNGRNYDINGNNRYWWDDRSSNEFRERTKCFVDQYQQYKWGGRSLPEMEAQAENIADNGGVRLAYEAYVRWQKKAVNTDLTLEIMPGFNYTNQQMFFISYGQVWCASTHADHMAKQAASDTHVPEKFRVLVPLSNFGEFSQVFNCPVGSPMNPLVKCEIY